MLKLYPLHADVVMPNPVHIRVRPGVPLAYRPGLYRAEPKEMEHRATALCSLQGRQECLPYLQAGMPVATCLSLLSLRVSGAEALILWQLL